MDKIAKAALRATGFKSDELLDAIIRVCNATGNPKAAVELLLGVYEEPKISKYSDYGLQAELISFDPVGNEYNAVRYKYLYPEEKRIYFNPDETDKDKVKASYEALENKGDWKDYEGVNKDSCYANTGKYDWNTSTTSLYSWEQKAIKSHKPFKGIIMNNDKLIS